MESEGTEPAAKKNKKVETRSLFNSPKDSTEMVEINLLVCCMRKKG